MTSRNQNSYNRAVAQIFSSNLLNNIFLPQFKNDVVRLLQSSESNPPRIELEICDFLELAYSYLLENYRCEYVYKNEIVKQILLANHPSQDATLLNELSSYRSIVDLVIVNGKSIAYEIKTELDSLTRLAEQVNSYSQLFDEIYVVTNETALLPVKKLVAKNVGLFVMERDGSIQQYRKSFTIRSQFDPSIAIYTLRLSELVSAHIKYVGQIPTLGTAQLFSHCMHWYLNLPTEKARSIFQTSLKNRQVHPDQHNVVINSVPSLKMALLGKKLTRKYCRQFLQQFS